jgi:hypothetical protein
MRRRRLTGRFAAWFVALSLGVDVIGRVAVKRDLRGDGRITIFVEVFCAELGLDPYLRQSVAELNAIARLAMRSRAP